MLFRQRTTQPEHFDDPARTAEEIRAGYAQLARVNRLFRLADPYTRLMSAWLGKSSCRRLSILDLGAGDCWLGREIEAWAQQQGWNWSVTSMDVNAIALQLHPGPARVVASAVALPFVDGAFDVVIASQMTHHLNSEADVALHFREAWRVANRGVFITDMQRTALLYGVVWCVARFVGLDRRMRADGLLSVRRSWRVPEWQELARRAGIPKATVRNYFGARLILCARKDERAFADSTSETTAAYRGADEFCSAPIDR